MQDESTKATKRRDEEERKISRRDRSPAHALESARPTRSCTEADVRTMSSSDSSFSSSFFSSSLGASAAAPPAAAPAAGAAAGPAPPAPTFERSSLTFLPSRAFARRVAQMGSSSMDAAFVSARILSDYVEGHRTWVRLVDWRIRNAEEELTVISMPSSARMRAA